MFGVWVQGLGFQALGPLALNPLGVRGMELAGYKRKFVFVGSDGFTFPLGVGLLEFLYA